VRQPAANCLAVGFKCRVTHPWALNPAAAKYYRPIRLAGFAAGFQKRSATPASYQMESQMAILIAYCIGMKKDYQTIRLSNIVEFCNSCWKMAKNAPYHIKSPVKKVRGRAKGGHRTAPPPLNTPLDQ